MREWDLGVGDPHELTLAADSRLCKPDYTDDQIWEIKVGVGRQPALTLQTTFGLRAVSMQIYPSFSINGKKITEANDYHQTPRLREFYSNYLRFSSTPFDNIDVISEYWVPESHVVAGRIQLENHSRTTETIIAEYIALLNPINGQSMAARTIEMSTVLQGNTSELSPIFILGGGCQPGSSPYPSLASEIEIPAGESRSLVFAMASLPDVIKSYDLARKTVHCRWESEKARLQLVNAGQIIDIETGNLQWDAAFAFSQKIANSLLMSPSLYLPDTSFVLTRQPDQGYSWRGDGSDYNHLWSGQTVIEAYYLSSLLLPANARAVEGIITNFIYSALQNGCIDWKPGLAGQRGKLLAPPILATLALQAYQIRRDQRFLTDCFPTLLDFIKCWFSPEHDKDGDSYPEWDHPFQSGFEDSPIFDRWHTWGQGIDIATVETPLLGSLLYKECQSLLTIARLIERPKEIIAELQEFSQKLRQAIEAAWDAQYATYRYIDYITHQRTTGKLLIEKRGANVIKLKRKFRNPTRLLIQIQTEHEATRRIEVSIHGKTPSGDQIEQFMPREIIWIYGRTCLTTRMVYETVEQIEISGLQKTDMVRVQTVDLTIEDCTLLTPLWAGIPDARRAEMLIQKNILTPDRYGQPKGIASFPKSPAPVANPEAQSVLILWNHFICEGLLEYGYRREAADLLTRMMEGIVKCLSDEHCFRKGYDIETGSGKGERNILSGLAPVGLFLKTLGVHLISPTCVKLTDFNPFSFPVTVKYCGMSIERLKDQTHITFPDGQSVSVNGNENCVITS